VETSSIITPRKTPIHSENATRPRQSDPFSKEPKPPRTRNSPSERPRQLTRRRSQASQPGPARPPLRADRSQTPLKARPRPKFAQASRSSAVPLAPCGAQICQHAPAASCGAKLAKYSTRFLELNDSSPTFPVRSVKNRTLIPFGKITLMSQEKPNLRIHVGP